MRELKNAIERALIEGDGRDIEPCHLHFLTSAGSAVSPAGSPADELPMDLDRAAEQARVMVLQRAVETCRGNVSEVTRMFGTSRNKVYRILELAKQA